VTLQVSSRHCHACSPFPRATKNDTSMQRGPDCQSGSQTTAVMSASHDHPSRGSDKSARAATIFIHNDAPQALLDCQRLQAGHVALGHEGWTVNWPSQRDEFSASQSLR
jgi:hypothetical protein